VDLTGLTAPVWAETQTISTGKSYELSNHLGNVLAVITDRKVGVDDNTDGTADYYTAALLSAQEYYPFGMEMPGRIFMASSTEGYRYGFNGKEQDDNGEWGDLTHYDYGARIYNPGIGRWLSVDPMAGKFAGHSPYNYVLGNPISMIDPDGAAPEWIDNGDGTYTAEAGDSALSLAKDAGISNGAANSLVTSQLGANYVGADGGLKSNVSIGDVIVGDVAMCESCHSSGPSSSPIAGPVLGASMEGGNAGFAGVPFALGVTSDAVGGVGAGASQAGGSMRLTNGAYNGNSFSPKYYGSGWKGGSVARIKTFNLGTAGKFAGRLGAASTFIFGAVDVGINMSQEGGYGQGAHTATLKTGGSLGGGGLGGWGGAALGSFGGPPGALIGGILGSIGGSLLGSEGGRIVAEKNPVDQPK
jgi:RHS repeat-associated protein